MDETNSNKTFLETLMPVFEQIMGGHVENPPSSEIVALGEHSMSAILTQWEPYQFGIGEYLGNIHRTMQDNARFKHFVFNLHHVCMAMIPDELSRRTFVNSTKVILVEIAKGRQSDYTGPFSTATEEGNHGSRDSVNEVLDKYPFLASLYMYRVFLFLARGA